MSPHALVSSAAWTAAGWTMLHLAWIGAGGGLVAALLRRLLRRATPETRHGAAALCLLALTAAPAAVFAWVYPRDLAEGSPAGEIRTAPTAGGATVRAAVPPPALALRRWRRPVPETPRGPVSARLELLVGYLPGVWLTGSLATLALVATGLAGVERLRRSSRDLEAGAISQRCRALARSLGIARRVGVAACDRVAVPVLIGVVRPLILLPPAALGGWSPEHLEMALLHELAHVRRGDNLVTLLQRLAESLLFFHPVTWWLSAWISLERETCCDRIVVEHTGRPSAYARLLAGLAGARTPNVALAMAEHALTVRIRRILNMEDRSMRMSVTEGLGPLAAAAIIGAALTVATNAGPPGPAPEEARRMLQRLEQDVVALPDDGDEDVKGQALLGIARARLKLGDRAAALATLARLDIPAVPAPSRTATTVDLRSWQWFIVLVESAEVRRDAGDADGARAALERAARHLELRGELATAALRRLARGVDAAVAEKPEGLRRVDDEEAAIVCESSIGLIDWCVALGEKELARTLIRRAVEAIGPPRGPMNVVMVGSLGGYLIKAGDPGGRELIGQARRAALALPDAAARAFALPALARTLSEAGDLDGALALVPATAPGARQAVLARILDGMTADGHRVPWLDLSGMNIKIGDRSLTPRDPAAARAALPKVAAAARAAGDARVEARMLATVALLQARAGDGAGALATARSIPELRRSDFPGPSDGFYDAVKPAALALIAGVQARAGDARGAAATFAEAEARARAVAAGDQRLVALVEIAQQQAESGFQGADAAGTVHARAVSLALTQPEPRRSRALRMLAEVQARAGDDRGALRTIEAIREYPGLEKSQALAILADQRRERGDEAASEALLRRAAACLASKAPGTTTTTGPTLAMRAVGRDTFLDFDLELDPELLRRERKARLQDLRARTGDVESVLRDVEGLPPAERDASLSQIAGNLARRGDVAGATDVAASIASPEARLQAFVTLASAIPEARARR